MTGQELVKLREQYHQYDDLTDTDFVRLYERHFPTNRSKAISDVDEILLRYDTNGSIISSYFELKRLKNSAEVGVQRRRIAENLLALERARTNIRQEVIKTQLVEEEAQMQLEYKRLLHKNQIQVALAAIEAGVPIERYADYILERMRNKESLEKSRMEFEQTILLAITKSSTLARYLDALLKEIDELEIRIQEATGDAKDRLKRWHDLKLKEYNDALEQRLVSPLDGNKP